MTTRLFAGLMALGLLGLWGCSPSDPSWKRQYPAITSYASVRTADLNGDGTRDLLIGAGSAEWMPSDTGFLALDGRTGDLLWRLPARNQIVGSAVTLDLTGDGTQDVILGGRSAELRAIEGRTGRVLWEFFATNDTLGAKRAGWYNFTTPQLIADQNGDGLRDLLIANGGDATLMPHDPNRPVGYLMILSSRDGKILAKAAVPDGRETYMTPVISDMGGPTDNPTIFFGTGGETLPGHFYRTTLRDLRRGDLSGAVPLVASQFDKGFIASPVLTDLNGDGIYDIVLNAVEGRMMAFDGKTNAVLWENRFVGTECYVSPAPGYFNDDEVPDFFVAHSVGVWPRFQKVIDVGVLDGRTGRLIGRHEYLNCSFTFAAPLTVDIDGDGYTEVVMGCNQASTPISYRPGHAFQFKLLFWDIRRQNKRYLADSLQGINWAATPYIGDLDGDGRTDLVALSEATDRFSNPEEASYQFPLGLNVMRKLIVDFPPERVYWGGYLGSDQSSVFTRKRGQPAPSSTP
jgi:outer membrane protein assembly factor BamB